MKAGRASRAIDEGYLLSIAMRVVDAHSVLRDYIILRVKSCTDVTLSSSMFAMQATLYILCA